jgi:hypothetical protein
VVSEPGESPEEGLEHFVPTAGRVTGVLGLLVAAGFVVLSLVARDDVPAAVGAGALVAGVLVWVSTETLHLRNMLETIHVPLAAVDELVVRQVLVVRVGEKKLVSPALGRRLRKLMRAPRPTTLLMPALPERMDDPIGGPTEARPPTDIDYVDYVEGRLRDAIDKARSRHGITRYSDEAEALARDVRRQPAWAEIAALVLVAGLFVLSLFL